MFPPAPQLTAPGVNKAASTLTWLGCGGHAHH